MSLSPTTTPPDDPEYHLPKDHWPLPELSHAEPSHPHPAAKSFTDVKASAAYQKLRRSFVTFAFPTSRRSLSGTSCTCCCPFSP